MEIGVGFQQRSVAGSKARKGDAFAWLLMAMQSLDQGYLVVVDLLVFCG